MEIRNEAAARASEVAAQANTAADDPLQTVKEAVGRILVGKEEALELLLAGFLAEGHVLVEDVPGVGKTLLAKSLAAVLGLSFQRLQCTPDLTPTDVTGFSVYEKASGDFRFRPGPVMTNILLVDEINRAVPRTQSSLLEAMEERQITVDGQTYPLPAPFLVIATQNPIEHEGTFPLPEAQLDRFLLKIPMGYPTDLEEHAIVARHGSKAPTAPPEPRASRDDVLDWQSGARSVYVEPSLEHYLVALVRSTRDHPAVAFGASPRASLALHRTAKALAFLRGRDFVLPDDIQALALPVLVHRLSLRREERLRGRTAEQVVLSILETVPVPVDSRGR